MPHVDPRLNCASEVCCPPLANGEYNAAAHAERVTILKDLGADDELADKMARAMTTLHVCFMPQVLADIIRQIAFP